MSPRARGKRIFIARGLQLVPRPGCTGSCLHGDLKSTGTLTTRWSERVRRIFMRPHDPEFPKIPMDMRTLLVKVLVVLPFCIAVIG